VAELADAPDLGSGGETHGGSSPPFRTNALFFVDPFAALRISAAASRVFAPLTLLTPTKRLDLGSGGETHGGSSPPFRTNKISRRRHAENQPNWQHACVAPMLLALLARI
jgi:hypothetical protein